MCRTGVCRVLPLALALVLVAAPGVVHADNGDFSNSALHARKPVSGQLPLGHPRLMRPADLDPAHPEQACGGRGSSSGPRGMYARMRDPFYLIHDWCDTLQCPGRVLMPCRCPRRRFTFRWRALAPLPSTG